MATNANKFPPKFAKNVIYPAVYNLDGYPMPQDAVYGDRSAGTYFSTQFFFGGDVGGEYDEIPGLTYGKHKFKIIINTADTSLPKLKSRSRIMFEIKDSAGTVILSDTTPLISNNSFTSYLWIKRDPLRTYNDIIQDGYAKLTIVGVAETTDNNWRNKYNVRVTQYINLDLFYNDNIYPDNLSPIIFQHTTGSMGSGSGLFISESLASHPSDPTLQTCIVNISASKMKTYSGQVKWVKLDMKINTTDSGQSDWQTLTSYTLKEKNYEDGIHQDYSTGINTLSEQFSSSIDWSTLEYPGDSVETQNNQVRFRLRFLNPDAKVAKDPYSESTNFELEYPNNPNEWLLFRGSNVSFTSLSVYPSVYSGGGNLLVKTFSSEFHFGQHHISIDFIEGGVTYGGGINPDTYGTPYQQNPGGGGGPTE